MQNKTITIINEHFDRESTKTRQLVEFNYEQDSYIMPDVSAFLKHMLEVELGTDIVASLLIELADEEEIKNDVLPVKKTKDESKKPGRFVKKKNA
jgi:putative N-acetylmannosamine-6-phosphate epimerase